MKLLQNTLQRKGSANTRRFLIFIFLMIMISGLQAQTSGDYRSAATGNWTTLASWQRYNGSSWLTPTTGQGYPGQFAGTGSVLIQASHVVTIGNTGITTQAMGNLTIASPGGQLYLNGGSGSVVAFSLNTPKITVNTTSGSIYFNNKAALYLPANASISVGTGGLTGTCNNNVQIWLGSVNLANCSGAPGNIFTFAQLMAAGAAGTFAAVPTSNSPVCPGQTINLTGNYTGAIGSAPTYSWSVTAPGGAVTTYSTQNVSIPSAVAGTYQATLTVSTVLSGTTYTNAQTITVVVNPTPTLTGASQAAVVCHGSSATINLSGLLPNTTFTVDYQINGTPQTAITGLVSGSTGTSSFTTPALTITNNGQTLQVTGITITSSTSNCTKSFTQNVVLAVWQSGSWFGTVSTDWNNAANWCGGIPGATTDVVIRSTAPFQPVIGVAGGICRNLTINSGASVTVSGSNTLNVYGNWINNGSFAAGTGTVTFSGTTAISGSSANSFYNVSVATASSLTAPASANINVAGNWINSGTFTHNSGTLTLNGGGAQTINSGGSSFNNLTITNIVGTCTASANAITVAGTFTTSAGSTLDMATNNLSVNTVSHSGTILTQSTSAAPLTTGKTWGGLVNYNSASSAQTAMAGTYNNFTISTSGGATASGDITINGNLNLAASNPSATKGCLEMVTAWNGYPAVDNLASYILYMGASATTTGSGDVNGMVRRNSVVASTSYTFGNQYTTISITPGTSPTLPSSVTVIIRIGSAPAGKTDAVQRHYEILPPGGLNCFVNANFHYLDSELNGNTESKMVTWDYDIGGGSSTPDEHGRAAYDFTNNYVGMSNIPIAYFIYVGGSHAWRTIFEIGDHASAKYLTWTGNALNTDWTNTNNWFPFGNAPDATTFIIIPDVSTTHNFSPVLPAGSSSVNTLTIESGGVLVMGSNTLVIQNSLSGGWEDQNAAGNDPGTSTVIFSNPGATVAGTAKFYNVEIAQGADITIAANSTMKIGNTITRTGTGTGKWFADIAGSIVEYYKSGNQTVLLPDGSPNYHTLLLSGSGTKTMPTASMSLHGDLILSGTVTTAPTNSISIGANLTIGNGTTFTAGSLSHTVGGNLTNNGTFNGTGSTIIMNGTVAQTIGGTASPTFNDLTNSNTAATVTAAVNFSASGNLVNSGVLDMAAYVLSVSGSITNTGTVRTLVPTATSATPLPAGKTWGGSVEYTASGGAQTVVTGTYNNLTLQNTSGTNAAGGNITVNSGTLTTTAGGTLNMGTAAILSGSGTFTNNGTISTSVPTATSATPIPSGKTWLGTIVYAAAAGSQTVVDGTFLNLNLNNTSGSNAAGGNITINGTMATTAGGTLNMGTTAVLAGSGTFTNNGIIKTSVPTTTSTTPIPAGLTWSGKIEYAAAGGAQTIVSGTYNDLHLANTSGTNNTAGAITVNGAFTTGSGGTLGTAWDITFSGTTACGEIINATGGTVSYGNTATNILEGTYNGLSISSNPATFCGAATVNGSFAASGTVNLSADLTINGSFICGSAALYASSGTVTYAAIAGGQNVGAGTYSSLKMDNTSGTNTACGNLTVNGILTTSTGGTLDMATYQLLGTLTSIINHGIIQTQHTGSAPIPSGKTWGGLIEYSGSSAQTAVGGTFNNLNFSGAGGCTASGDITVNGILNLIHANPTASTGILETASYTLIMGASSTTTGTGDVTGVVKRQHTFGVNTPYSFGNQFTTITFNNFPASTRPGWVSCRISLGSAPSWRGTAVKRTYSFARDAGDDRVILNLHYLDSELDPGETNESQLVLWDAHNGPTFSPFEPHGKSNNSTSDNWVGLTGMSIGYVAPSATLDNKQWSMSYTNVAKIIWTGNGFDGEDWALPGNWNGGVPTSTDIVLIPAGRTYYPTKNLDAITYPAKVKTLEIEAGASVTAGTYDITVYGAAGAWVNNGTFVPGNGTVYFANGSLSNTASISGTTNFYDLTVNSNTFIQPASGSIIRIGGALTAGAGSILNFTSTSNTVEYNGSSQTVINPAGPGTETGYSNLVLSNSGTKTLSGSAMTIKGDFMVSDLATAAPAYPISVTGNFTIAYGAAFTAGNIAHEIKGNFYNEGTFSCGTGSVRLSGTTPQIIGGSVPTTFNDLEIDNISGVTTRLNTGINGILTLSSGKLNPGATTLTIGTPSVNGSIAGGSSSAYIVAYDNGITHGTVRFMVNDKNDVTYFYPVGDSLDYTPFTFVLNAITTSISGAYLDVFVKAAKIPGLDPAVSDYISRYWDVTPGGTFVDPNYNVVMVYTDADIAGTESSYYPIKTNGTDWYSCTENLASAAIKIGNGSVVEASNTLLWAGVTSFSQMSGAGTATSPLPVTLLSFTSRCDAESGVTEVSWTTATETNNDYFTLESSNDAENWQVLAIVNGAANSNSERNYAVADHETSQPSATTRYYRLKQTDLDGSTEYFRMISVRPCRQTADIIPDLTVTPNPFTGVIRAEFNAEKACMISVRISSMNGTKVWEGSMPAAEGSNIYSLNLQSLTPSVYFITISNGNKTAVRKIVKTSGK